MKHLLNTLYITSPNKYLSLEGENVVIGSLVEFNTFVIKALTLLPCVAEQYRGDTSETVVSEERG